MHHLLPLNILIIDDDEDDYFITSEYLKSIQGPRKINTEWCFNYKEALNMICDSKFHIYW
jgi:hypothetical protein